ncbi:MAG: hypothetical protein Ta2G_10840 [Termitinemataceae bacterium]|nr:MAG: hypothetical protein Ta2G_10840 [Termitinemataceae bacterium]
MTKVDSEKQQHYNEKVKNFELNISRLQKKEAEIVAQCRLDPSTAAPKLFQLADDLLNLTSNFIVVNGISASVLMLRNEEALNEGRKTLSKAIIYLENVVTGKIDAPYSEYEENLAELSGITPEKKLYMVKKLGLTLSLLEAAFGDNTKWRWIFVDLQGKFAAVAKNLLDFKKAQVNNDPSSPDYEPILYHIFYVKQILGNTADRFRERFDLATKRKEDLRVGLLFLSSLKRIHIMLNERDDAANIQKKIDNWTALFDSM